MVNANNKRFCTCARAYYIDGTRKREEKKRNAYFYGLFVVSLLMFLLETDETMQIVGMHLRHAACACFGYVFFVCGRERIFVKDKKKSENFVYFSDFTVQDENNHVTTI